MQQKVLLVGKATPESNKLAKQLEAHFTEVLSVSRCVDGYKAFEKTSDIDVVVVDVDTSEECGLRFLRKVSTDYYLRLVPILVAGTTFTDDLVTEYHKLGVRDILVLPIEATMLEAKIDRALSNGRPQILIVDDEPMIVGLIRDYVEMVRYKGVTASGVDEALAILESSAADIKVVVSDILMPGKNGFDLLVAIKEYYHHIPVVLITGQSGRFTPKDALAAGADGYFTKPFHNQDLLYTIRRLLTTFTPSARVAHR